MRTAIAIHGKDINRVLDTYHLLSTGRLVHSFSTMLSAGLKRKQLGSGLLFCINPVTKSTMYESVQQCTTSCENKGNVSINIHALRSGWSVFCLFMFCVTIEHNFTIGLGALFAYLMPRCHSWTKEGKKRRLLLL
jgi:hypothetical protein